ncbi:MAG: type II/IV secretion system ATPase subunit [Candidatus Woesearchaeota archaeon]|nr:MAG: type II/IV secretion system ATPase subunit [Candidatus Woesearchaeota archaeon]
MKKIKPCSHIVSQEGGDRVLKINCEGCIFSPSIEDHALCMRKSIDNILEEGHITKISFLQKQEYVYDSEQTALLVEIANLIYRLTKEEDILSSEKIGPAGQKCTRCFSNRREFLRDLFYNQLKEDPIVAYRKIRRRIIEEGVRLKHPLLKECIQCEKTFISTLDYIKKELEKTKIISRSKPFLKDYKEGDRTIYTRLFKPSIRPNFMYTQIASRYPTDAEEIDNYILEDGSEVSILKLPNDVRYTYHLVPPEFKLTEPKYEILSKAREIIAEHKPKKEEFIDPQRTRSIFYNIEKDLIRDLIKTEKLKLTYKEIEKLSEILVRYTIGFGLVEILLTDPKIQDVSINAPVGINKVNVVHADHGECITNISFTEREIDSWATKLRMLSGRPLDQANPVLDANLEIPGGRSRVCVIQDPLSPFGLAFSFRRHRERPWTLPLFIKNGMLTPLAAGLFSFLIDGSRTILIAGTRSAGKTSLMSSLLVEIMRSSRIITVEDTPELPVSYLQKLNYDIQPMKVRSVIVGAEGELSAAEGIRTSLRLGDSSLIIGEVRSKEAIALYEAMRVGALANVVAGTIHGSSPYDVFDRVVNDLGVPRTSFKATDIIAVANPIKSASGLERNRRLVQVSEVRKFWEKDPLDEKGFADLMKYDAREDKIVPTDVFTQGDSYILKEIASNVREWVGDWDAVWDNIVLRARIKKALVDLAKKTDNNELLEAEFVVESNDKFHEIAEAISQEIGVTDPKRIYSEWELWLKSKIKE